MSGTRSPAAIETQLSPQVSLTLIRKWIANVSNISIRDVKVRCDTLSDTLICSV
jgi:hypothetical protein